MRAVIVSLLLVVAPGLIQAAAPLDLGSPTAMTPYDPYLGPVRNVFARLNPAREPSMKNVMSYLRTAKGFRYSFSTSRSFTPMAPSVTASKRQGDCKDKSLWLANQMGDGSVRFVIGKLSAKSKLKHAWLLWENGSNWYILDPTMTSRPIPAGQVRKGEYVAYYSYSKNSTFRHGATTLLAEKSSPGRAVASKSITTSKKTAAASKSSKSSASTSQAKPSPVASEKV